MTTQELLLWLGCLMLLALFYWPAAAVLFGGWLVWDAWGKA